MAALIDIHRRALIDALADAAQDWDGLRGIFDRSTLLGGSTVARAIGGQGKRLDVVVAELVAFAESRGLVETLLQISTQRTPGHQKLNRLAAVFGLPNTTVATAASSPASSVSLSARPSLKLSRFDLEPQEQLYRTTLAHPDLRMRVFIVADDLPDVADRLLERLQDLLTDTAQPMSVRVTLNPQTQNLQAPVAEVAKYKDELKRRHMLVRVLVRDQAVAKLDEFLLQMQQAFQAPFLRHLVLFVVAPSQHGCTCEHIVLPPPQFAESHLYVWVDGIAVGLGWQPELVRRFKLWLRDQAGQGDTLNPDTVYNALSQAIDHLCNHQRDEIALRELIGA